MAVKTLDLRAFESFGARAELARRCGCSISYVSLLLQGKRTPSLAMSRRLAAALGIGLDELNGWLVSLAPSPDRS